MTIRHLLLNSAPTPPPPREVLVLCASKGGKPPAGLEHLPWPHRLLIDSRPGWVHAANALLDEAQASGTDAIFVDDDVTILPETFQGFEAYRGLADVFGFRLLDPAGKTVHAGYGLTHGNPDPGAACYAAHVTASLLYLTAGFLRSGIRF